MKYIFYLSLCIITLMLRPSIIYLKKHLKIRLWKKKYNITHHELIFKKIYENVNGYKLSKQARSACDAPEYTYGEIEFQSFIALLSLVKPTEDTTFYDLGCGTGKAIIAACMVYNFKKAIGIELFDCLYKQSVQQKSKLLEFPEYLHNSDIIDFINDDFLNVDFSDATLIYINSTAFSVETWQNLDRHLAKTAIGATIMTMSKKLISPEFALVHQTSMSMSWGVSTVFIHIHQGFGQEWSDRSS